MMKMITKLKFPAHSISRMGIMFCILFFQYALSQDQSVSKNIHIEGEVLFYYNSTDDSTEIINSKIPHPSSQKHPSSSFSKVKISETKNEFTSNSVEKKHFEKKIYLNFLIVQEWLQKKSKNNIQNLYSKTQLEIDREEKNPILLEKRLISKITIKGLHLNQINFKNLILKNRDNNIYFSRPPPKN